MLRFGFPLIVEPHFSSTNRAGRGMTTFCAWRPSQGFDRQAYKRLEMLDAATGLEDLRALPGNRLEALKGDRPGQYSIRVNMQWRICFEWPQDATGPSSVEIVD